MLQSPDLGTFNSGFRLQIRHFVATWNYLKLLDGPEYIFVLGLLQKLVFCFADARAKLVECLDFKTNEICGKHSDYFTKSCELLFYYGFS